MRKCVNLGDLGLISVMWWETYKLGFTFGSLPTCASLEETLTLSDLSAHQSTETGDSSSLPFLAISESTGGSSRIITMSWDLSINVSDNNNQEY